MTILTFTLLLTCGGFLAGALGALSGLGGGVVIVPMLTLLFDVDIRYAIGASLVSVIATSSGAAAAYVEEGFANLRAGMFLEIATTLGAVTGASLVAFLDPAIIGVIFGVVLLVQVATGLRQAEREPASAASPIAPRADRLAARLRLDASYPTPTGPVAYHVSRVPAGLAIMGMAGALSGLIGIGSGALKVLALDKAMRLPLKVSTTTSDFMIGVTAAASAGVYLQRGYIDPGLAMPVMLGVLAGALAAARVLPRISTRTLHWVFLAVMLAAALEMLYESLTGAFG